MQTHWGQTTLNNHAKFYIQIMPNLGLHYEYVTLVVRIFTYGFFEKLFCYTQNYNFV